MEVHIVPLEVKRDEAEREQLEEAFRKMLEVPSYSDVVLVCGDGSRVSACKSLLAALSPLFTSIFSKSGRNAAEIALPRISSRSVLLLALEYMCTGAIVKQSIHLDIAYQLLHCAHLLVLPRLEDCIVANIVEPTILRTSDPAALAQQFSRIVASNACNSPCLNKVLQHIVKWLRKTDENPHIMSRRHLWNLPWEAMQIYLDMSKTRNDMPSLSIMEYMRLRDILMWAACHMSSEAEVGILSCLPHERYLVRALQSRPPIVQFPPQALPAVKEQTDNLVELKVSIGKCAIDWSQAVKLRAIHPLILMHIVKPLNVIEPSDVFDECLFFQALYMLQMKTMIWVPASHQLMRYRVEDDGRVLAAVKGPKSDVACGYDDDDDDKFVRANRAFNKLAGIFTFDVLIQKKASNLAIGVAGLPLKRSRKAIVCVDMHGRIWYEHEVTHERVWLEGNNYQVKEGSCISVYVDMKSCSCRFSVDANKLKDVEFTDLPDEVFPLAYVEPPGKLKITLNSNADSL